MKKLIKNQKDYSLSATVLSNDKSNSKLAINDPESKEWVIPYVIEPSAGVDRGVLALLNEAYTEERLENDDTRIVLKFNPRLAPIKVAVIPLKKNNSEIVKLAHKLYLIYIYMVLEKLSLALVFQKLF